MITRTEPLSVLRSVMLQDYAAFKAREVALSTEGAPDLVLAFFSGIDAVEHHYWAHFQPERFVNRPAASEIAAFEHLVAGVLPVP